MSRNETWVINGSGFGSCPTKGKLFHCTWYCGHQLMQEKITWKLLGTPSSICGCWTVLCRPLNTISFKLLYVDLWGRHHQKFTCRRSLISNKPTGCFLPTSSSHRMGLWKKFNWVIHADWTWCQVDTLFIRLPHFTQILTFYIALSPTLQAEETQETSFIMWNHSVWVTQIIPIILTLW